MSRCRNVNRIVETKYEDLAFCGEVAHESHSLSSLRHMVDSNSSSLLYSIPCLIDNIVLCCPSWVHLPFPSACKASYKNHRDSRD